MMAADNPMRIVSIRYRGFNGHIYTKEFGSAAEFRAFGQKKDWYKIRSAVVRTANGMEFELAHGYWNIPVGARPRYQFNFVDYSYKNCCTSRWRVIIEEYGPVPVQGWSRACNGYRTIRSSNTNNRIGVWC